MAEKLLTLIQDTTGDKIYPNVKEDNLPPSVRGELQKIDTKQDKLTNTQMYAVNSGITQYKVGVYDGYDNKIKGKQDKITASTVNPFVKTVDGTGIDLYQITLDANGNLSRGPVVDQIPTDTYIQGELDNKQDTLVSGTNIKTINGQSILGSGDLPISGGGGESVSPTLNLMDLEKRTVRTTITEQEKINLEKGLYNQVLYSPIDDATHMSIYTPTKFFSADGAYFFALFDGIIVTSDEKYYCSTMSTYVFGVRSEPNTSGEYPIALEKMQTFNLGSDGGSSEIPTLSTIAPSMSDLATTVYSDADIALIKKQKYNFIKVPFGTAENNTSELCYVFSLNNAYSLIDIAGTTLSFANSLTSSPNFLYFDLDETTKKLTGKRYSSLSTSETSLYVESSTNKIFLTDQLTSSSPTQILNKAYYFDKINGKSIIHEDSTINNYDLGKTINLFGNHSILVPNASTDTEINLYNHFIKITGTKDTTQVIARFTIQSSNNLVVDTSEKLTTLLGNEFELGCNGIYGNYSITGLKKTSDGALNIIYNNGGAESLQSVASLTNVTFNDTVTTI